MGSAITDNVSQLRHRRLRWHLSPLGQLKSFKVKSGTSCSEARSTAPYLRAHTYRAAHPRSPSSPHCQSPIQMAGGGNHSQGRPAEHVPSSKHGNGGNTLVRACSSGKDLWLPTQVLAHIWPKAAWGTFQWQAEVLAAGTQARPKPTCRLAF